MTAKKLLPGQLRFVVKKIGQFFRVYDVGNASYPYETGELGKVTQDVPEDQAQLEADRLNEKFVVKEEPPKKQVTKNQRTGKSQTVQLEDPPAAAVVAGSEADLVDFEIEEYDMDDEAKKKYEEGLFEDVKY